MRYFIVIFFFAFCIVIVRTGPPLKPFVEDISEVSSHDDNQKAKLYSNHDIQYNKNADLCRDDYKVSHRSRRAIWHKIFGGVKAVLLSFRDGYRRVLEHWREASVVYKRSLMESDEDDEEEKDLLKDALRQDDNESYFTHWQRQEERHRKMEILREEQKKKQAKANAEAGTKTEAEAKSKGDSKVDTKVKATTKQKRQVKTDAKEDPKVKATTRQKRQVKTDAKKEPKVKTATNEKRNIKTDELVTELPEEERAVLGDNLTKYQRIQLYRDKLINTKIMDLLDIDDVLKLYLVPRPNSKVYDVLEKMRKEKESARLIISKILSNFPKIPGSEVTIALRDLIQLRKSRNKHLMAVNKELDRLLSKEEIPQFTNDLMKYPEGRFFNIVSKKLLRK